MDMKTILAGKASSKQPAAKGKAKAKKPAANMPVPVMSGEPKTVRITQAQNGLTVSCYGEKGETMKIARDLPEAMKHVEGMMK